ncbi:MAG: PstS family phosphate ABC transporter substrate-binding protein [Gemmatimonadales bacterium]|jgi:phosphate transport system substrate-binding protein
MFEIFRSVMPGTSRALRRGLLPLLVLASAACGDSDVSERTADSPRTVRIDGSSTVYLISEAVAEEYQARHPDTRVTVGVSGSGGGFQKFCVGETDISDASREINRRELEACLTNGIVPIEIVVGLDGITLVVNAANDFVSCLTTDELRRIWQPGSHVKTWSDIRSDWPDENIELYGPGADSGTFDYFTQTLMGEVGASRPDFAASEDDNVLVRGVAGGRYALGYFGYAYYVNNADKLKAVAIDDGDGCVPPNPVTIETRAYSPLARPLFLYINPESLKRREIQAFAEFYLMFARTFLPQVGYVPLSEDRYRMRLEEIRWRAEE